MFREELTNILSKYIDLDKKDIVSQIEIPPDSKLGDYSFPCFKVGGAEKANELKEKIASNIIERIETKGPYLNFFIKPAYRAEKVIEAVKKGVFTKVKPRKILIEYPSPNTNKPLHLGHVRNMVLGSTLSNILKKAGHKVIQVNLNNNRGIHICKSMLAYKLWGENKEPNKKSDHFVGDFYVKFNENKSEDLEKQAQEMLKAWENKDPEVRKLWEKMNSWAVKGFNETYKRYNVKFDKTYDESDIYEEGKKIVEKNISKFVKDETGAIIAPLEKYKLPDKVVVRADGTSIYMTQDIALTILKEKDFKPDLQIWIVANEQKLHFQQLFKILEILGLKEELYHLAYGMVFLPEGRMKSREGNVVDADDILDELESLATKEIKKRHEWDDKKVNETSKKIAISALRFFMLKFDALKDFTFDPESSLSFEGDTGPYLQYTHARICSILRKTKLPKKANLKVLANPEEQNLLKQIEALQSQFERALNYKPSAIANQLLEIARAFNTFYHSCPVLKAEDEVKNARLELILATKSVINQGLEILGIESPEEM